MIRTYLSNSYIKRTIRPLFGWTQATPKPCFLDPAWNRSVPMWPGMGYVRTGGDLVAPVGASSGGTGAQTQMSKTMAGTSQASGGTLWTAGAGPSVYGLGALYVGGDGIDELLYAGINAFAVWVLGPDAEFEVLAPAFDTNGAWAAADPGDGSGSSLIACSTTGATQGMLQPWVASTSQSAPVAKLLKVNSPTKITIGGLSPYDAQQLAMTSTGYAQAGRN